eukprot:TRINITY_DN34174_c0_g1_i1.p1 TRINITY_DN34174_c0_g1~~TRINITY_DN34174_c0_g1_i1.p1  ORF type:complete len:860 (+),score=426.88 TRINITY_DN34174_c0_g1_i1:153-2582(+)
MGEDGGSDPTAEGKHELPATVKVVKEPPGRWPAPPKEVPLTVRVPTPQAEPRQTNAGDAFPQGPPKPLPSDVPPPLSPSGRWLHTAVLIGTKMYVYGGVGSYSTALYNDMWLYNYAEQEWTELQASFVPPFPKKKLKPQDPDAPSLEQFHPGDTPSAPAMREFPGGGETRVEALKPNEAPKQNGPVPPRKQEPLRVIDLLPVNRGMPIKEAGFTSFLETQQHLKLAAMCEHSLEGQALAQHKAHMKRAVDSGHLSGMIRMPKVVDHPHSFLETHMQRKTLHGEKLRTTQHEALRDLLHQGVPTRSSVKRHHHHRHHDRQHHHHLHHQHRFSVPRNIALHVSDKAVSSKVAPGSKTVSSTVTMTNAGPSPSSSSSVSNIKAGAGRATMTDDTNAPSSVHHLSRSTRTETPDVTAGSETRVDKHVGGKDNVRVRGNVDAAVALLQLSANQHLKQKQKQKQRQRQRVRQGVDPKPAPGTPEAAANEREDDSKATPHAAPFIESDLWEYDLDSKLWRDVVLKSDRKPVPRWLHSAVNMKNRMMVFGGVSYSDVILGDIWLFFSDEDRWVKANTNGPPILPREGHSAVVFSEDYMWVFGGISYGHIPFNDVWVYDATKNIWQRVETQGAQPPPRWLHTSVGHMDSTGVQRMYVYGGCTRNWVPLDDLYILEPAKKLWLHPSTKGFPAYPRYLHNAVILHNQMYVMDGMANNLPYEDMHEFDLPTNTWTEINPAGAYPFAREGSSLITITPPPSSFKTPPPRQQWLPPPPKRDGEEENLMPLIKKVPTERDLNRPRKEYNTNRWFVLFGGAGPKP